GRMRLCVSTPSPASPSGPTSSAPAMPTAWQRARGGASTSGGTPRAPCRGRPTPAGATPSWRSSPPSRRPRPRPRARPGGVAPPTAPWSLRNSASAGAPDAGQFAFGGPGWIPLVGDWNGDGTTTVGVFDPATATFYLKNTNQAGAPDYQFTYGGRGWIPV